MPPLPVLVTRRLPASAMRLLGGSFAVSLWEGDGPMPRERLLAAARGTAAIVSLLTDRAGRPAGSGGGPG